MSDLVKRGVLDELEELNAWFAEAKRQLGMSQKADRGRVMATISKLGGEIERMKEEQLLVANYYNYAEWGYIVRAARDGGAEKAYAIELPEECKKLPTGWVLRENGLDYGVAMKLLPKVQKLIIQALAHIAKVKDEEEEGWAEATTKKLIEDFANSTDPDELTEALFMFVNDLQPEDPETTWVEAAAAAAVALEKATDLPLQATDELIAYAYGEGVEITKKHLAFIEQSDYREAKWFDYLLTAYLRKSNQVSEDEVEAVSKLKHRAFELWKCYELESANDPLRPKLMKRIFAPSVSVAMLEAACNEVCRLDREGNALISDEWADAVVEAVAKANGGDALVVTTEKTN